MHKMSQDEVRAFLTSPVRTGKLATVREDGRPHVAPIWFALDGDDIIFNTGADTVKGRNLRRTKQASLCIDDETPPFSFVTLDGDVELSEDLAELKKWAAIIGGRYMGADKAEALGQRNGVPGELLFRFKPRHVVAVHGMAD